MRVHEFAKQLTAELGKEVKSSQIIDILSGKKEGLKAQSSIDDAMMKFVRESLGGNKPVEAKKEEPKKAGPKKEEGKKEAPKQENKKVQPKPNNNSNSGNQNNQNKKNNNNNNNQNRNNNQGKNNNNNGNNQGRNNNNKQNNNGNNHSGDKMINLIKQFRYIYIVIKRHDRKCRPAKCHSRHKGSFCKMPCIRRCFLIFVCYDHICFSQILHFHIRILAVDTCDYFQHRNHTSLIARFLKLQYFHCFKLRKKRLIGALHRKQICKCYIRLSHLHISIAFNIERFP